MKKCDKKLDELCDKTSDLEDTVRELTSITKELSRIRKIRQAEKVPIRR